jgi:nucleotide-binding universal stress UspA family protein
MRSERTLKMGYNKILIPLDGSKLAEGVLKQVKTIAAPKAHVHLIHVNGPERGSEVAATARTADQPHPPMAEPWMTNPDLDAPESIERYETYLKRAGETLTLDGYWVTVAVRQGQVAVAIIEEANNGNFDVIAIARHSRAETGHLVLGSVAQSVLAKAHCAVLALPPVKTAFTPAAQIGSDVKIAHAS